MEENTELQDLFESLGFTDEEKQEISTYSFSTEGQVDNAIESVKELDADEERLKALYNEKVDELKLKLDSKVNKIDKKRQWLLFNIKNSVKTAGDAKETKTMFKKDYLAGTVVIKKPETKLIKPDLTEAEIKEKFPEYTKEETKVTLNWADLKKIIKIIDGKPVNSVSGEILDRLISVELTPETVVIK